MDSLGEDPERLSLLFSISNFSGVLGGLFNLLSRELGHVLSVVLSALANILLIIDQHVVTLYIALFLMNIAATGLIGSCMSLAIERTHLLESNTFIYLALLLGNAIGISCTYTSSHTTDYVLFSITSVAQIICAIVQSI